MTLPTERLTLTEKMIESIEDPILEQMDRDESEPGAASYGDTGTPASASAPFDIEIPRPRAVPLERLYRLIGQDLPPGIAAVPEGRAAVLVHQGITAFNPPGRAPASVWGLGYEIRLLSPDADTLSIQPSTELLEVARLNQDVDLGLTVGGSLEPPPAALSLASAIPGFSLQGVRVAATTEQSFRLAIRFRFELLKIQAGPVGAGGARWNFYRQDQRLDGFQPLLHTILVPRDATSLDVSIHAWVVRAGGWFGLKKPIRWMSNEIRYQVPIEGVTPAR
jgi:hypothetical protein